MSDGKRKIDFLRNYPTTIVGNAIGLNIWCNARLPPEAKDALRAGVGGHRIVFADEARTPVAGSSLVAVLAPLPSDADVAFGQPDPAELLTRGVRWVHLSSAGYTRYDRDDLRAAFAERGAALTNSSDVYDEPVAQHLLAMMLALARALPRSLDNQRAGRAWDFHATRATAYLLKNQTVLILGFGHIARRLAELLAPLRLNVIAVRRRVRGDEQIRVRPAAEVDQLLPLADHVVDVLPSSPETTNFLDARRIGLLKPGAVLYNAGRGDTLDQAALIEALRTNRLAAAYLDVTDPEPLPPDHPLWATPNCYITPHTAGGHDDEMERLVGHFLNNFRRFAAGRELLNRVF